MNKLAEAALLGSLVGGVIGFLISWIDYKLRRKP